MALTNAVAAGGVKASFEAYDYINDKPLTSDNLKDSGKNILYAAGLSSATAGMPIIPATALGVITDRHKDNGEYDVVKTTGGNIVGTLSIVSWVINHIYQLFASPLLIYLKKHMSKFKKGMNNDKKRAYIHLSGVFLYYSNGLSPYFIQV